MIYIEIYNIDRYIKLAFFTPHTRKEIDRNMFDMFICIIVRDDRDI